MNICLFSQEEINQPLSVNDERGEHIIKILHKKEGDSFSAGIINGMAGTALINRIEDKKIFFSFKPESEGKSLYPLKMIIGFPRPIQLKRLLRDIAALGVCEVHLTGTELGEKSYMQGDIAQPKKAFELLKEGCQQAASTHIPQVETFDSLKSCLNFACDKENQVKKENRVKIALDNVNPASSLDSFLSLNENGLLENGAIAAIGNERGWTDNERAMLEKNGFALCSMGNRILRTETAATVAASIILNEMGVLK